MRLDTRRIRRVFRLFGFEVTIRTGFVIFLALIVFLYPDRFGVWLAAGIAVFTLVHELGHAVAARSAGADAAISLDFMAGYTSFRSKGPLSHARRALISVAGPASQIAVSVAVLVAMGVNPLSIDSVRDGGDAAAALWWAGPMIGLLNLVPVLPLDGGHLAQTGIEAVLRRPALREMAIASLVVTIAGAVLVAISGRIGFIVFIAFLLLGQIQILQDTNRRRAGARAPRAAGWQGDGFLQGGRLSPWQVAHRELGAGQPRRAADAVVGDLVADATDSSDAARWPIPAGAPADELRAIVDVLPRPLPDGNAYSQRVLAEVLVATGAVRDGGEYAAAGFDRHRTPLLALVVARAAARMQDDANALSWVEAAVDATQHRPDEERVVVARVLDIAPELQALRHSPGYRSARARLDAAQPG